MLSSDVDTNLKYLIIFSFLFSVLGVKTTEILVTWPTARRLLRRFLLFTLSKFVILKEVWIVEDPATTVINIVFLPSSPGLLLIIIKLF